MARLLLLPLHCQQTAYYYYYYYYTYSHHKICFWRFQIFFFSIIFFYYFFFLLLYTNVYYYSENRATKQEVTKRNSHDSVVMDHLKRVFILYGVGEPHFILLELSKGSRPTLPTATGNVICDLGQDHD